MSANSEEQDTLTVLLADGSIAMDFASDEDSALPDSAAVDELDELGYALRGPEVLGDEVRLFFDLLGHGVLEGAVALGLERAAAVLRRTRRERVGSAEQALARVVSAIKRADRPGQIVPISAKPVAGTDDWIVQFTVSGIEGAASVRGNGAVVYLDFDTSRSAASGTA